MTAIGTPARGEAYRLTVSRVEVEPLEHSYYPSAAAAMAQVVAHVKDWGLVSAMIHVDPFRCETTGELLEFSITKEVNNGTQKES